MIEIAERKPAMLQIAVDTSFGFTPVRRARSAFVADARTYTPKRVCPSSHHSPSATRGTTISTSSCGPWTVTLPTCHSPVIGLGNAVCSVPVR